MSLFAVLTICEEGKGENQDFYEGNTSWLKFLRNGTPKNSNKKFVFGSQISS